jgi:NAD(P)H-flavin reductase/hemoglobin-like flavoprotein
VAIALDGGFPDAAPDRPAGQLATVRTLRHGARFGLRSPLSAEFDAQITDTFDASLAPPTIQTDIQKPAEETPDDAGVTPDFDPQLVRESFARVASHAEEAMEYFFAQLFKGDRQLRAMFPLDMSGLRPRAFIALSQLVSTLDNQPTCDVYLAGLARSHRKFGVRDWHYQAFFEALLDTIEHFAGLAWTSQAHAAWRGVAAYATRVMQAAAASDAASQPPWWVGEIVAHELRAPTIAAISIRPDQPLQYEAGQFVHVQVAKWPRVWRPFSVASAPGEDGLLHLHVRAVPGGLVSNALIYNSLIGDTVLLGAAEGSMTAQTAVHGDRDVLAIAGGTGLAPIKAIIEQLVSYARSGWRRRITLFFGARGAVDLYDMHDLGVLAADYSQLEVIPVLSHERPANGLAGLLPEVVRGTRMFDNPEAYICGPDAMVRQTALMLSQHVPAEQIHHDPLPAALGLPTGA